MNYETDHEAVVHDYIDGVLTDRIVAGELVKHACRRHLRDLAEGEARGLRFNPRRAAYSCDFFHLFLEHTDGEYNGQPFILHSPQRFLVWVMLGWEIAATSFRRFRQAFISMGRGSGKSPFAAGLLLLLFAFDWPIEPRAEGYCFATKCDQAKIVFRQAKRYLQRNPHLRSHFEVLKNAVNVIATDSSCQPLGSDSDNSDGLVPHVTICDELHAWAEHYRELWEKIETAHGKRRQDFSAVITTAGSERSVVWLNEYEHAKRIVTPDNGYDDDAYFVYIAEMDDDDSEFEPRSWEKANPLMAHGVTQWGKIERLAEKARASKASKQSLRRFYCNKLTSSFFKPIDHELWQLGNRPLPADLAGRLAFAGFDWGWRDDLAALAWCFPLAPAADETTRKRRYAIRVDAWCPRDGKRDLTQDPWARWIDEGWLTVTDGDTTDIDAIYQTLDERSAEYHVGSIAVDPHNAIEFVTRVQNQYGIEVFEFQQTAGKYNNAMREFLKALQEGRLDHGGDPLLEWCATNLSIRQNSADYMMPCKRTSADKIDPIVASVMAIHEASVSQITKRSYYEDHDLELLF